jgi:hypothetical protein
LDFAALEDALLVLRFESKQSLFKKLLELKDTIVNGDQVSCGPDFLPWTLPTHVLQFKERRVLLHGLFQLLHHLSIALAQQIQPYSLAVHLTFDHLQLKQVSQ